MQVHVKLIEIFASTFILDKASFKKSQQAKKVGNHWSSVLLFIYLWLKVKLVSRLLKLPDFSDDVRNLKSRRSRMLSSD